MYGQPFSLVGQMLYIITSRGPWTKDPLENYAHAFLHDVGMSNHFESVQIICRKV